MKVVFVDDDVENVEFVAGLVRDVLSAEVIVVTTVEDTVRALHDPVRVDVLVMDLFIPMGRRPAQVLGPRARKYEESVEDLGGLVILDELDRVPLPPVTLLHTACRDHVLLQLLGERVAARVRKPAPAEVLLDAVLEVVRRPA